MPSAAVMGRRVANIVLGDRHGGSCAPALMSLASASLIEQGLSVARNDPYAGGYTTSAYGAPHDAVHVLQIEIDRSLYMDEVQVQPHAGLHAMTLRLQRAFAAVMRLALPLLAPRDMPMAAE